MSAISTSTISSESSFQDLAEAWNRLAALTDPRCVFLRHEWFDAAWGWAREECELNVVCVRRSGALIGICPFVRKRCRHVGIPVRSFEFLAVPDTQQSDLLADPSDLDDVVRGLAEYLNSGDIAWDVMILDKLRSDSLTIPALEAAARHVNLNITVTATGSNPGLALTGGWAAYYGRRSRRLKKGNNLIVNRLTRAGRSYDITCYDRDAAGSYDLRSVNDILVSLSAKSWKAGTGLTLDNNGPHEFLDRLSRHAFNNGWYLIWILRVDGEPAAMELQLDYNGVVAGLRADYDEAMNELSPGTLLNWQIIERLFDRGADFYSLGPGSNTYKMRWAEVEAGLSSVTLYANTMRGMVLHSVETRLRPAVKRVGKIWKSGESK